MKPNATCTIWNRPGGLDPHWVSVILASDFLFVRSERERYDLVIAIIEARRSASDISEEHHWNQLIAESIYYEHLSFDDLMYISRDISPSTGRQQVSPSVIHGAHWRQSILRYRILGTGGTGGSSPVARDKDLGICTTTEDIMSQPLESKLFFPVPGSYQSL